MSRRGLASEPVPQTKRGFVRAAVRASRTRSGCARCASRRASGGRRGSSSRSRLTISLLMCSIGGLAAADNTSPASSAAASSRSSSRSPTSSSSSSGPTVAANSIASEREGRTWEAVLLTGLTPKDIARGKFLAAYTTIALLHRGARAGRRAAVPLRRRHRDRGRRRVRVPLPRRRRSRRLRPRRELADGEPARRHRRHAHPRDLHRARPLFGASGSGARSRSHKLWPDVPEGFPIWLPLAYTRAPLRPRVRARCSSRCRSCSSRCRRGSSTRSPSRTSPARPTIARRA